MGASSSTDSKSPLQLEQESLAASTLPIPTLRLAFSALSPTNPNPKTPIAAAFSITPPPDSPPHLAYIGAAVADHFFNSDDKLSWVEFLNGYNNCCARGAASPAINNVLSLYQTSCNYAGVATELEISDGKVGGTVSADDLCNIFLMCWMMTCAVRGDGVVSVVDVNELVVSAMVGCGAVAEDEKVWELSGVGGGERVEVGKVVVWMVGTIPGIVNCLSGFVQGRLKDLAAGKDHTNANISAIESPSPNPGEDRQLLTPGRAWTFFLALKSQSGEDLLASSFQGTSRESEDNLLYRSSLHGKGLSRFWSGVEGYHGPMLILVSANSDVSGDGTSRHWVIGILTEQGFENSNSFYGNSGHLYAVSPIFRVFPPSGKDTNFMYCHLHPTVKAYDPHPKPVGLAFGGSIGNERIYIDEDFDQLIIRHHAYDHTYQHGSLIPNQGFLPTVASLVELEVWGLGGKSTKEMQDSYKKREELFSQQRRKVDLKTFGNWEDSPEKAMMDMVSDPNRARREDR